MAGVVLALVAKVLLEPGLTVGELAAGEGSEEPGEDGAGAAVELEGCPVAEELDTAGCDEDGAVVASDGDVASTEPGVLDVDGAVVVSDGLVRDPGDPVIPERDDAVAGSDEDVGSAGSDVAAVSDEGVLSTVEAGVLDGDTVVSGLGGGVVDAAALLDGDTSAVPMSEPDGDTSGVPRLVAVTELDGDDDASAPCAVPRAWRRDLVSKDTAGADQASCGAMAPAPAPGANFSAGFTIHRGPENRDLANIRSQKPWVRKNLDPSHHGTGTASLGTNMWQW